MAFGVYVHIPYCIQRCSYCDFATYEQSKILPPEEYVQVLLSEIRQKKNFYPPQVLDTLYFGGGTPSLLPPHLIVAIIEELARQGFTTGPHTEITLEINPATINEHKLETYLKSGFNRFSVGAQTFDDALLKMVKREHNAKQTLETLDLLRRYGLNFSFDILFALPRQTLSGLKQDVQIAIEQGASHISPYCLTVPESHPLSKGRPVEETQVEMFDTIASELGKYGFLQYEISNFAKPGNESRHNLLYWTDEPYWGLGLSSHSYAPNTSTYGARYWNLSGINEYVSQIQTQGPIQSPLHLPTSQFEALEQHQALTDFCHTSMRLLRGLNKNELRTKFPQAYDLICKLIDPLKDKGLVQEMTDFWSLTQNGIVLSNKVFEQLTFLKEDI